MHSFIMNSKVRRWWGRVLVTAFSFTLELSATNSSFVNVAWHKPVKQAETSELSQAWRSVDGNTNQDWTAYSCSSTGISSNMYWIVDLLDTYPIHHIAIANRNDISNAGYRLQDFYIYVSNTNPLPINPGSFTGDLCLHHEDSLPVNGLQPLYCNDWINATQNNGTPITGRYVYVWKGANMHLTMCEVEVYVEKAYLDQHQLMSIFTRINDKKIVGTAFHSVTNDNGVEGDMFYSKCVMSCTETDKGVTSLLHMNVAAGVCECFENVNFNANSWPENNAVGWVIYKRDSFM